MQEVIPPHVNGADGGVKGLFAHMHYSADAKGPNDTVRRHRLSRIFETTFLVQSGAPNADYIAEFGNPNSQQRFEKMLRFLDSNLQRFGNRTTPAWLDCLEKWSSDADWLVEEFGSEFGYVLV
tara:strand:- start:1287 stop:1655 length:369 start_codon:yes stop_codon:yes gene_type:complete